MKTITVKSMFSILLMLLLLIIVSCERTKQMVEKPENIISVEDARALQRNYIATRAEILRDTFGYEDVRDVTFSLSEIKRYISYVENQLSPEQLEDAKLRIYFGAYEATTDKRFGLSTVFIAPVLSEGKQQGAILGLNLNLQTGFEPLNKGTGGQPPNEY